MATAAECIAAPGAEALVFPSQFQATVADDQLIVARSSQSFTAVRAARRQSRTTDKFVRHFGLASFLNSR
jgi:hypothetical protein